MQTKLTEGMRPRIQIRSSEDWYRSQHLKLARINTAVNITMALFFVYLGTFYVIPSLRSQTVQVIGVQEPK